MAEDMELPKVQVWHLPRMLRSFSYWLTMCECSVRVATLSWKPEFWPRLRLRLYVPWCTYISIEKAYWWTHIHVDNLQPARLLHLDTPSTIVEGYWLLMYRLQNSTHHLHNVSIWQAHDTRAHRTPRQTFPYTSPFRSFCDDIPSRYAHAQYIPVIVSYSPRLHDSVLKSKTFRAISISIL